MVIDKDLAKRNTLKALKLSYTGMGQGGFCLFIFL